MQKITPIKGDDRVSFLNATITGDIFVAIGNSGYA